MTECVLCDWSPDALAEPWAVYRPGHWLPLHWPADQLEPEVVNPLDTPTNWPEVALVHHWAVAHPGPLMSLVAHWEVDRWPRTG